MLEQHVSPSVRYAAQLSVFLKGNVSISSPNPFSLSNRRDGISLEPIVFFAYRRYCLPSNHKRMSPRCAATIRSYHACVSILFALRLPQVSEHSNSVSFSV
jgi:hypothetical protein